MQRAAAPWHSALTTLSFVALATAYLPAGLLLRYLTLQPRELKVSIPLALLALLPLAFLHEFVIRGVCYRAVRERLPSGFPAILIALIGTAAPLWARLAIFPSPRVAMPVVVGQAAFVEFFLSMGLTWIALGTSSIVPGAVGLIILWTTRFLIAPRFHGGVVPMLEVWMALLAAVGAALVLHRPLAPHREDLFGGD
jgi:hypothetical protein